MRAPAIERLSQRAGAPVVVGGLRVAGGAQRGRAIDAGDARARLRRFLSFAGPGAIVAVGYIDPGNWAADLAGGSRFAYGLLSVVLLSSLMAMLLQALCVRLGIASGQDLAEATRDTWPRAAPLLWVLAEVAVAATDLAEILGSAIALELLFHIPIAAGVALTGLDVLLLLGLERAGRRLDAFVAALVLVVAACFAFELALCRPEPGAVLAGYLPSAELVRDGDMLYLAVAILGATVMPHNLYLHSSLVKARAEERRRGRRRRAAAIRDPARDARYRRVARRRHARQLRDPGARRRCLPRERPRRGRRPPRRAPPPLAPPRVRRRRRVRGRAARGRPERDPHRHHGRPGRDDGVPPHPDETLGAPALHAGPRPRAGARRRAPRGRAARDHGESCSWPPRADPEP